MLHELPVLLRDVGVLQVLRDLVDLHIDIVSRVDNAENLPVRVINDGIRETGEVLDIAGGQLIIGDLLQALILRAQIEKPAHGHKDEADQKAAEKEAADPA